MKPLMVSNLKIGTMFKAKNHSGIFVKVEHPNIWYQDSTLYYVDKEVKNIIENY